MWWVRLLIAMSPALPLCAELKWLRIEFAPSECAACTQSLPERLARIRGVTRARLLEGASARLEVEFSPGNRVRLGRVRETIEQDGTKWLKAHVEAAGLCEKQAEGWRLKLFDEDAGVPLKGRLTPGPCSVKGEIARDGVIAAE